ncbi:hypothetical protein [Fischerella thermalis]|uniref:Uncharacterized protein n=1 Tax=Fischerella thermalis CCMEE 5318 TaxID=2019666 RepID=A0A2N6LJG6_9CYAN|nr:hypothetical protein [Fischerella thermalis]PMB24592.1 hypothetical protein CEN46_07575 [Fischerella thermalis CCMEE 5318]
MLKFPKNKHNTLSLLLYICQWKKSRWLLIAIDKKEKFISRKQENKYLEKINYQIARLLVDEEF